MVIHTLVHVYEREPVCAMVCVEVREQPWVLVFTFYHSEKSSWFAAASASLTDPQAVDSLSSTSYLIHKTVSCFTWLLGIQTQNQCQVMYLLIHLPTLTSAFSFGVLNIDSIACSSVC